jgi:hypothetical protein
VASRKRTSDRGDGRKDAGLELVRSFSDAARFRYATLSRRSASCAPSSLLALCGSSAPNRSLRELRAPIFATMRCGAADTATGERYVILFKGTPAAFNYTYGPALIYRGPRDIDRIYKQGEPVVVVADVIPVDELRKIELTRVRGWVFEEGRATDEDLYNFLFTEKRAAVISCKGARKFICDGDMVAVDGIKGLVCLRPNDETLAAFQEDRKKGPPTDKGAAIQSFAKSIMDGLLEERKEKEERGEEVKKTGEVMTKEEAKEAAKNAPGLIYQLLSGIPLPNSPTAGHHGHQHPEGEEHDHDHDHDHEGEGDDQKMDARARREAQRAERAAAREKPDEKK